MIATLHVTQAGLRLSPEEMAAMHRFVAAGGIFNVESLRRHNPARHSLIALTRTEDGQLWIRDGYHRLRVIEFYGRPVHADEYFIEERTYEQFRTINLARTWVTPIDLRTEVRKPDFFDFKEEAMRLFREGVDPTEFILQNKHRYAMSRDGQADLRVDLL